MKDGFELAGELAEYLATHIIGAVTSGNFTREDFIESPKLTASPMLPIGCAPPGVTYRLGCRGWGVVRRHSPIHREVLVGSAASPRLSIGPDRSPPHLRPPAVAVEGVIDCAAARNFACGDRRARADTAENERHSTFRGFTSTNARKYERCAGECRKSARSSVLQHRQRGAKGCPLDSKTPSRFTAFDPRRGPLVPSQLRQKGEGGEPPSLRVSPILDLDHCDNAP
jgi:hypothetical protein